MKFKEYEMPDGKKAVFEYDESGVGKITLECMDMLMGLINNRKTEPQTHDLHTNTHECVKDTHDKTENSSEIPNNCEHITEDGVTCAKYPACDDCLDNPLNKVKGSERLVKGKTEPQKWETPPKFEHKGTQTACVSVPMALIEDEPQTCSVSGRPYSECADCEHFRCTADEPQTERNEK